MLDDTRLSVHNLFGAGPNCRRSMLGLPATDICIDQQTLGLIFHLEQHIQIPPNLVMFLRVIFVSVKRPILCQELSI